MFNDERSDFDVLVASDAIGMGLNLNISRIIFSTTKKFDGIELRDLSIPEIKQIAGTFIHLASQKKFLFQEISHFYMFVKLYICTVLEYAILLFMP